MSALESALVPIVKDDHIVRVCVSISTSYSPCAYSSRSPVYIWFVQSPLSAIYYSICTYDFTLQSPQPLLLYAMLVMVISQSNGFVDSCTNT